MAALDPASVNFLEAKKVKPLLDLTNTDIVEAQFTVAREFLKSRSCKGVQGIKCHASSNDSIQTRTNIWGINCYV